MQMLTFGVTAGVGCWNELSDRQLAAVESLCILARRIGFDSAEPEERRERILAEPWFGPLRAEAGHDVLHLPLADRTLQGNKQIRRAQVAIVFWNFVFQDEVI